MKEDNEENLGSLIESISLTKLKEESKKITNNNMLHKKIIYDEELVREFLYLLPCPSNVEMRKGNEIFFKFDKEKVLSLVKQAKTLFE